MKSTSLYLKEIKFSNHVLVIGSRVKVSATIANLSSEQATLKAFFYYSLYGIKGPVGEVSVTVPAESECEVEVPWIIPLDWAKPVENFINYQGNLEIPRYMHYRPQHALRVELVSSSGEMIGVHEETIKLVHPPAPNETVFWVHRLAYLYPRYVKEYCLGKSTEGREIWGVLITDEKVPMSSKELVFTLHGEDAVESSARWGFWGFAEWVVENAESNPSAKEILEKIAFFAVPDANPDGVVANTSGTPGGIHIDPTWDTLLSEEQKVIWDWLQRISTLYGPPNLVVVYHQWAEFKEMENPKARVDGGYMYFSTAHGYNWIDYWYDHEWVMFMYKYYPLSWEGEIRGRTETFWALPHTLMGDHNMAPIMVDIKEHRIDLKALDEGKPPISVSLPVRCFNDFHSKGFILENKGWSTIEAAKERGRQKYYWMFRYVLSDYSALGDIYKLPWSYAVPDKVVKFTDDKTVQLLPYDENDDRNMLRRYKAEMWHKRRNIWLRKDEKKGLYRIELGSLVEVKAKAQVKIVLPKNLRASEVRIDTKLIGKFRTCENVLFVPIGTIKPEVSIEVKVEETR